MNTYPRAGRKQQGIAVLEFMLTVPLLVLVVFAVSELGWAFHQYHTMTRATQDGARHAASHALTGASLVVLDSALVQETSNLVVYGNTVGAGESLLPGWSTEEVSVSSPDAIHVEVRTRYSYVPIVGRIPAFYGGDPINMAFEMNGTVQMRAL